MKLKIIHQNQKIEDQSVKNESMELDQTVEEEPDTRVLSEEGENFPIAAASHPMLLSGKRKRKPKELIDEVSPIMWWKKKKKKFSASKSKSGMLESGGNSKSDAQVGGSNAPIQSRSPTMIRAEEVKAGLGNDPPNFMKVLVRSHVGSCFWMGLPVPFCKIHLPGKDTTVILEDEDGVEYPIKYIAHKTGLSAGWRKFVSGNKLLEGDVLIFQLIGSCRLKVYIIRANDLNEVDGALSLLILDSQTKQSDADAQPKKKRCPKSLPLTVVQNNNHNEGPLSPPPPRHPEEHSGNDSVASEVLESSKFSIPSNNFEDINNFEQFHITVNGVSIDSEIPENIRRKYYNLCRSKNAFLHERLLPGLYCKLAAGVIFETVNTVEAIRNCKLTTPKKEFQVWEKSLRSFELLGLNVGFIRARLGKLMSLVSDSESGEGAVTRYLEVKTEREKVEDEIQLLEAKLDALKHLSVKFDGEIQELKRKAERYQVEFQEEVNAPW